MRSAKVSYLVLALVITACVSVNGSSGHPQPCELGEDENLLTEIYVQDWTTTVDDLQGLDPRIRELFPAGSCEGGAIYSTSSLPSAECGCCTGFFYSGSESAGGCRWELERIRVVGWSENREEALSAAARLARLANAQQMLQDLRSREGTGDLELDDPMVDLARGLFRHVYLEVWKDADRWVWRFEEGRRFVPPDGESK